MLSAVIVLSEIALRTDRPLVYIVFPTLIWAALRFGPRGGTLAVAVAVGFTLWKTAHHAGPFVVDSIPRSTLSTQLYVSVAALSTMFLAAVVAEREAIAKGLLESRARLVGVADRERRRLENNLHDGAQLTLTMLAGQLATAREESRRNPDLAPGLFEDAETHLLIAIDELRDLAHGIHPTILTDLGLAEADSQPDRRLASPDPAARAARRPARLDRGGDRVLRRRRGAHERPASRPCEDDHDPGHRVGALPPADRGRRRRRRRRGRAVRLGPPGPAGPGRGRGRRAPSGEQSRPRDADPRGHSARNRN